MREGVNLVSHKSIYTKISHTETSLNYSKMKVCHFTKEKN